MANASTTTATPRFSFLPPIGSRAYYILLALVAIFILGPLGGIAAAYMNFSLGFFIGGQVLAGILGSLVTIGDGLTLAAEKAGVAFLGAIGFSASNFGAGMIVGARIGVPAIVVGLIGLGLTPWLREVGLLGPHDPWRKVGFLISLGTILGAAAVDITLVLREALARHSATDAAPPVPQEAWKRVDTRKLVAWTAFWAVAVVAVSASLGVPVGYAVLGVVLASIFVLINGISIGISDSNPISSAFVVGVTVMALAGLTNPIVGLLAGAILLISTVVGADMQQDRSTGWRLGTNRTIQFRYQVIGIFMGAVFAVVITKLFLAAYPVLKVDTFLHPEMKTGNWQSAMTYKFAGVLRGLTSAETTTLKLMGLGVLIGLVIQLIRLALKRSRSYQAWKERNAGTETTDFVLDTIVLPGPYASSLGGFVEFPTAFWYGFGGIFSSIWQWTVARTKAGKDSGQPQDMDTTSLVGGGLIAGEALAFLTLGIIGLLSLASK